jgi:hypothetical protein
MAVRCLVGKLGTHKAAHILSRDLSRAVAEPKETARVTPLPIDNILRM